MSVPLSVALIIVILAILTGGSLLKRLFPDSVETIDIVMAILEVLF